MVERKDWMESEMDGGLLKILTDFFYPQTLFLNLVIGLATRAHRFWHQQNFHLTAKRGSRRMEAEVGYFVVEKGTFYIQLLLHFFQELGTNTENKFRS